MSAGAAAAIEGVDLTVELGGVKALDGVSIRVEHGEAFAVMGPSGCGKTTLLRCLVRLWEPTSGRVHFEGRALHGLEPAALADLRRRTGLVFQGGALLNSISLEDNVALPMRLCLDLPPAVVAEAVRMRLGQVGLLDAGHKLPAELSGGMRKRASIARALALAPEYLFLDEPTSGLDPLTADGIDELLLELRRNMDVTLVVVTHDLASARKVSDRVLVLDRGRAVCEGTWPEVDAAPQRVVQDFLARRSRRAAAGAATALGGREETP